MLFSACSANETKDYAAKTPTNDIRHYLSGRLEAYGMLQDRGGEVTKKFVVKMEGRWKGNEGELEEHFQYDDGKTDQRTWKITFTDDHHFTATAHDCIGIAQGSQHGDAMNMKYTLRVPYKDSTIDLAMDDWIFMQMDGKTALNVTSMKKFGFEVGRLTLVFHKL